MDRTIEVNGKKYSVKKRGTLAKTASARVRGSEITVSVPASLSREEGFHVYLELLGKITAKMAKRPEKFVENRPIEFQDGQEITLMGRKFAVSVKEARGERSSSARLAGETVEIFTAKGLDQEGKTRHVSNLVRRVISSALLPLLDARVRELNQKHFSFSLEKVFLKQQMTRWGSCSENGNVNLSFRLLFAPPEVLDS